MASPETSLIELAPTVKPYAAPETVVGTTVGISGRLPKAVRTISYIDRYRLKESGRGRVTGIQDLEYRSQIGRSV